MTLNIALLKRNGRASIHATDNDPQAPSDYSRGLSMTEVVDGKPVKDWPEGVSKVETMPPEPST